MLTVESRATSNSWNSGVSGYIQFLEQFPTQFQKLVINEKRSIFFLPFTGPKELMNLFIKTGSSLLTIYTRINDLYFVAFQAKGKEMQLPFKDGEELFPTKRAWRREGNKYGQLWRRVGNKYALENLSYFTIHKMAEVDTIDDLDMSIGGIKNAVIQLSEDKCSEDLRSSYRSILIILYGVFGAVRFKPYRNLVIFNTYQQVNRMGGGVISIWPIDPKFNWNSNHAFLSEKGKELIAEVLMWNWSKLCSYVIDENFFELAKEDMKFDEFKNAHKESQVFEVISTLFCGIKTVKDVLDTINLYKMKPSAEKKYKEWLQDPKELKKYYGWKHGKF